ncbi:MAG: hypothetical protein KKA76_11140 [Proteobacteria bacterium]|nr:hypothetical protein [Pseudomonadota bacterium]
MTDTGKTIAEQVAAREKELLGGIDTTPPAATDLEFIRSCFAANERGDGLLLAALIKNDLLYVTTPDKKGEWYRWENHVWEYDEYDTCVDLADRAAQAYEYYAEYLESEIAKVIDELEEERQEEINKTKQEYNDEEAKKRIEKLLKKPLAIPEWMAETKKAYEKRAYSLRAKNKINTALNLAPRLDRSIATVSENLDQKPLLLPAPNGVIDLKRGVLVDGLREDYLTKKIDVNYNTAADYTFLTDFFNEVCIDPERPGTEEMPAFLKRLFGYSITGKTNEEFIFIFIGPGRNGKGVIFSTIADIMGPYYHEANRSLFLEQKYEPPPSATSEHMFALLGKRIVVGAETNKGQKIDSGRIKHITGDEKFNYRQNYGSEKNGKFTHSLFLQTNNMPYGLTKEFSLTQRLVIIELPYRFVDDIEEEEAKYPALKGRFKKKNNALKTIFRRPENREGVLKWLVEGCLEWQEKGLQIPDCVINSRDQYVKNEDYLGQFISEIMEHHPEEETLQMIFTQFYELFENWWKENIDKRDNRAPHKNTISKELRDRGYKLEKIGGVLRVFHFKISQEVLNNNEELAKYR